MNRVSIGEPMRRRQINALRTMQTKTVSIVPVTIAVDPLLCKCGFQAKDARGLAAHLANSKVHKDEK